MVTGISPSQVDCPPEKLVDGDSVWRTMDGRRIRLRDMGDRHLLNAIRMLRGRSPIGTVHSMGPVKRRLWLNAMANEAYSRDLEIDPLTETDKPETHE